MNHGLPKLVVERLRATQAGAHPDADLLTAFIEQTLSPGERDSVMQHLAACLDCREIIALSAPEQAIVPPSVPARSGWLTWPYLRWGAALACAVVVGAAVTLRQEKNSNQAKLESVNVEQAQAPQFDRALNQPALPPRDEKDAVGTLAKFKNEQARGEARKAPAATAPRPEQKQLTLQARNYDSLHQFSDEKARADSQPTRAKEQNEVVVSGGAAALAENKAPENKKDKDAERGDLNVPPTPAAPAGANESVEVTAAAPVVQTESASVQKAQSTGRASARAAAKTSGAPVSNLNKMVADSGNNSQLQSLDSSLGARWTLSPEGLLQRSLDSGATWTAVTIAPNIAVRAVSASGFDVWVGGAAGALFHSSDNGMHWKQVRPSMKGKALTEDIIGLEFKELSHGQLTTANEIWTTSDAGKTWSRSQK